GRGGWPLPIACVFGAPCARPVRPSIALAGRRTAGPSGGIHSLMPSFKRTTGTIGILGAAGMAAVLVSGPLLVSGADHLDAPSANAHHRFGRPDIYAFRPSASPT